MYVMSRIDRGTRSVEYWTGHNWAKDKAEALRFNTQQDGFNEKERAGLQMPVTVNKE